MTELKAHFLKLLLILQINAFVFALKCREILVNNEIKFIDWKDLRICLTEVNVESLPGYMSENIWRLLKASFNGIENIPPEAFGFLGYTLTTIPLEELRSISMERVEAVEAFGAIRASDKLQGFNAEQSALIAKKVQDEWLGKNPETYSEYDLISMGEILCYLNVTNIEAIHADAFRNAAEWIGNIRNCPLDRLEAFAKLAKRSEAFGEPSSWSKLVVYILGNILNGLSQAELQIIDEEKLLVNRYYTERNKNDTKKAGKTSNTRKEMPILGSNNSILSNVTLEFD